MRLRHIQPKKSKAALTGFASPVTATTNFLAPDILNKCGRAVSRHFPTLSEATRRLTTVAEGHTVCIDSVVLHAGAGLPPCHGSGQPA